MNMQSTTSHITEHDILEFEYGLLEDGDLEQHRDIVGHNVQAMIAEIRRLRLKAGEFDLSGLTRWKVSEWHCLENVIDMAAPFWPLRQFLRAVAAQQTEKPTYSGILRDSGLHPVTMNIAEQMCRSGGLTIELR